MNRSVCRLGLGLAMAWTLGAGWAAAQEILLPPVVTQPRAEAPDLVMPTVPPITPIAQPVAPSLQPGAGIMVGQALPMEDGDAAPQRRRWLASLKNRHGYGCGVDANYIGCTTCRDELRFIFGSCRTFFGEPCLSKTSPSRLGTGNGYGGSGSSGGSCSSCNSRN